MKSRASAGAWAVMATLTSTILFGFAPILGKFAYRAGVDAYTLVMLRTVLAAGLLWLFYLLFWRRHVAIRWRHLLGCAAMGVANGIGSLLYYTGLVRLDASLGHLLYAMYPFWVFIFLSAAGHAVSRLAVLRLGLALVSVVLLSWQGPTVGVWADPLGVTLMIGAGALYGWHLVLGQWTLADLDARTVTLYGLTSMAAVVAVAWLGQRHAPPTPWGNPEAGPISVEGWAAIVLLAVFPTALARLLVFTGLRRLGGFQTSLLSIAELLVAVAMAFLLLGESFSPVQWMGAGLFVVSVLLIGRDTGVQVTDEETWWQSLFGEEPTRHES